jgi:ATP-dependent RNA helicase DHX29
MAKKKKTQLKPVARGFATTSVPKKVVPVEEDTEAPTSATGSSMEEDVPRIDNGSISNITSAQAQADEFDPNKVEEQSLQNLVDRLQSTTEKDIIRTVKVHLPIPHATPYSRPPYRLLKWTDDFQRPFHP